MSGRMSTNTGVAPRSTKALAVETKVNDGHDDLVAGPDVEQQRRHLEGVRARGGQQRPGHAEQPLELLVAPPGERAVAGEVATPDGGRDPLELVTRERRPVERDAHRRHVAPPSTAGAAHRCSHTSKDTGRNPQPA